MFQKAESKGRLNTSLPATLLYGQSKAIKKYYSNIFNYSIKPNKCNKTLCTYKHIIYQLIISSTASGFSNHTRWSLFLFVGKSFFILQVLHVHLKYLYLFLHFNCIFAVVPPISKQWHFLHICRFISGWL